MRIPIALTIILFSTVAISQDKAIRGFSRLETSLLSINPAPGTNPSETFSLKVRVTNKCIDSLLTGDTIDLLLYITDRSYDISRFILVKNLRIDSSVVFLINDFHNKDQDAALVYFRCGWSAYAQKYSDTSEHNLYRAELDLRSYFPKMIEPEPYESKLEVDYSPMSSELRLRFYSPANALTRWTLTDNQNRQLLHGFIELTPGKNPYSIMVENLPQGRYTLTIGENSEAVHETFTVFR